MEKKKDKEKVYFIFNSKEDINVKIGKAFEIYIKDYIKTKEELENNQGKD